MKPSRLDFGVQRTTTEVGFSKEHNIQRLPLISSCRKSVSRWDALEIRLGLRVLEVPGE